ncbi:MAG TPA: hypothetical protein VN363_02765, partial [Anaerolineales bacterium]|nr:hypothetical protein [Anaerolineales bacterium]
LVVENAGFLPTMTSEQAKKRKAVRPVRAELALADGNMLVSGKVRQELGHLEGRSNKWEGFFARNSSPTDNRARVEWVVQGKPGDKLKVKVLSERAGSLEKEVELS